MANNIVRKPKKKKVEQSKKSWQTIVFYVISILVVLSMALGLVLSMSSKANTPTSMLPLLYL